MKDRHFNYNENDDLLKDTIKCPTCKGDGYIEIDLGIHRPKETCTLYKGTGRVPNPHGMKCPKCNVLIFCPQCEDKQEVK